MNSFSSRTRHLLDVISNKTKQNKTKQNKTKQNKTKKKGQKSSFARLIRNLGH
jgi:hypothetical protein